MAEQSEGYAGQLPVGIPMENGNGVQVIQVPSEDGNGVHFLQVPVEGGNIVPSNAAFAVAEAERQAVAKAQRRDDFFDKRQDPVCSVVATCILVCAFGVAGFLVYVYALGGYEVLFGGILQRISLDDDAFVQVVFANDDTDVAANNAFVKAATTWSNILNATGVIAVANTLTTFNEICSLDQTVAFPNVAVIDRLFIAAVVAPNDGAGGVLASAGPCGAFIEIEANGYFMPALGVMTFDSDDIDRLVDNDELEDVILHEMAHVLGFGSLWDDIRTDFDLGGDPVVEDIIYPFLAAPQPENQPIYTGAEGMNGRVDVGGGSLTPVEVEDGSFRSLTALQLVAGAGRGSVDSHWMENIYEDELMTPAISGSVRPLSVMSLRSMRDLGYAVDTSFADPYTFDPSASIVGSPIPQQKITSDDHGGHYTLLLNDTFRDPAIPYVLSKLRKSQKLLGNGRRRLGGPTYITLAVEAVQEYRQMQSSKASTGL